MINITDKYKCCGCSACSQICPRSCINMAEDKEGFIYPKASSEECINCGMCEAVCPYINKPYPYKPQAAFAGKTRNIKTWINSSSGGAFTELCNILYENGTYIYGASWDNLTAKHIGITKIDDIIKLQKSKYIQSDTRGLFIDVKRKLIKGHKVIFSGTPCQISALRNFLKKEYDSLFTIDIICHGVGSPKVFHECLNIIGEQYSFKIKGYGFREKVGHYTRDHISKITNDKKKIYVTDDPFIQLFSSQRCTRPACLKCFFRDGYRYSDITIGDCKGINKVFKYLSGTKYNYSTITVNSEKGKHIVDNLYDSMEVHKCTIDSVIENNPIFFRDTFEPKGREKFFKDFEVNAKEAILRHTNKSQIYKLDFVRKVYYYMPVLIRKFIIKVREITR